jgi:hypothetical protein
MAVLVTLNQQNEPRTRLTCERIDSNGTCGDPATLAVKVKIEYEPHSPNCTRKGHCLGHPVCDRHGNELRAEDALVRIKSYPPPCKVTSC